MYRIQYKDRDTMSKFASGPKFDNCTFHGTVNIGTNSNDDDENKYSVLFHNNDRYGSDTHRVWILKTATTDGISLALELRNERNGNLTYSEYWHYNKDEDKNATDTMQQLIKSAKNIKQTVENKNTPLPIVANLVREAALNLDRRHKERSNVYNFNYYLLEETSSDWRNTLYGNRYPEHKHPGVLEDDWTVQMNKDNTKQKITTQNSNRKTIFKYERE